MKLIALLITYIFINNFILVQFMGLCPFIGVSKNSESAIGMGLAVTFVTAVSSVVCYLVYYYLLAPFSLEYLQTVVFILVIASLVQVVERFIRVTSPSLYKALGIYLPLITTNCIVLGISIININEKYDLLESFTASIAAGLGFTLVIILMSNIRERLELSDVPKAFRGLPIVFITAGLMALAFMGFDRAIIDNLHLA
ncbi:MAG TPA: electron transport complex subunit RsxA [Spirochaetaceae bacterium]|nr:electron transport complex subunit RsxA [Spirochaetaceae bacterium]